MATTPRSMLITQAQALMKEKGLSYADAAKQVRANVTTPAPTTTPNPVTTPALTPTVNTIDNKQELLQSTKGLTLDQRRAVMQNQAASTPSLPDLTPPTTTPTPTPTPVTPKAPEPVTPTPTPVTPPKVETPVIDYNVGKGRETEIATNLNEGFSKDTTVQNSINTGDIASFRKAYGYDNADDTKKKLIDDFFNSKVPKTEDSLYNLLRSGQKLGDFFKNNPQAKLAQDRYSNYMKYSKYDAGQLQTALTSGNLVAGTKLYNDLYNDPAIQSKLVEAQKLSSISGSGVNLENIDNSVKNEIITSNPTTASYLSDGYISGAEYNQMMTTPEIKAKQADVEAKKNKYDKLKAEYDYAEESIKAQYPNATSIQLAQLTANARKSFSKDLEIATDEYNNAIGTLADMKKDQGALIEMNLNLYKENQAFERQKQLAEYQASLSLKTDQAKFEQGLAQQAQLAKDPVTGVKSILATYAQMGITPMRSEAQIIADIEKQVAQGVPVEQALTELNKAFQSKPEYKQYMAYKKAQMTPTVDKTPYQLANLGDGKAIMYNQSTGAYNVISSSGQPVTTQEIPSIVEQCRTTGSCGQGVNDYLQKLGDDRVFGNTYSDKQKKINSTTPAVGSIAVWQPTGKMAQPEYGHVGIVTAVNGDQVTVTDWNWNGDNKQSTHTVPLSSILANDGGFYVPKTGATTTPVTNKSSLPLYRSYVEEGKLPSKDALKGLGLTSEQFAQQADTGYNEYLKSKADEISKEYPTLNIEYTGNYSQNSATQREKLNESIAKIGDIDNRLQQLKEIFNKVGTEVLPTTEKAKMNALRQQIILKAKEVENLGVLNGPDLGILESLLPATTGFMSGVFSFDDNTLTTINQLQSNYRTDAKTKAINYGAKLQFTENDVDTIKNEFNSFN